MVRKNTRKQPAVIKQPEGQEHELADNVIDTVREPLIALDQDLRVVKVNRCFYETFKLKPEETVGQHIYELGNKQLDIPRLRELLESIIPQTSSYDSYEIEYDFPDVGKRTLLMNARRIPGVLGKEKVTLLAIEDITERKQAEMAGRESEERLLFALDSIETGEWDLDLIDHTAHRSLKHDQIFGYETLLPQWTFEMFLEHVMPEDRADVDQKFQRAVESKSDWNFECRITRRDGEQRWIMARGQHRLDPSGQPRRMAGIVQDITERKQAETALLGLSEEKYQTLVENINDVLIALDIHGNMTYVSPVVERLSKYKVSDLIGKPFTQLIYPDDLPALSDRFTRLLSGELEPWEFRVVDKDGRLIFVRTSSRPVYKYGEVVGITTLMTDITERRKTEEALHESESLLKATGQMAKVGGWEVDAKTLEVSWTEETYIIHELPLGYKPPLEEAINYFHPEERQKLSDSIQRSLKSGEAWDMEMRFITANGKHLWTRAICSPQVVDGKTMKLRGTFQDITDRKLAEEKLTKSYESLQKTLHDAINTMVKIVEMRDPYTAGHQNKVADLAVAIAREMKLDDTRVDQLRMSAVIHDVGKMYVPSDILAKPGKLANIELDLIKTHSQGGYDIVKSMDLPCSVANTVLQHHERLDGSGYPNQLKGEDTLLEAKILAVADVIEAMSSHRPYRPALGLDKALEEISKNKGKLYDPGVVDTCLGLFNAGKFEFKAV